MTWHFTTEQREFQRTMRQIAERKIQPLVKEIDRKGEHSSELVRILGESGTLGLPIPEKYGGSGADCTTMCIALEEMGRVFPACAVMFRGNQAFTNNILGSRDEELKEEYLTFLARDNHLGGMAMTEPGAGSDNSAMTTRARRDGNHWVINGTKAFISNIGVADVWAIMAVTDPNAGRKGISAFVVPAGTLGLTFGKPERKIGLRGSVTGQVFLEDVRVPARNLIGEEGQGFAHMMRNQNSMRTTSGAVTVGLAAAATEHATEWARTRIQFGRPIGKFQGIQFMLADMAMQVSAARALMYETAARVDRGETELRKESSMVKCYASEMAMRVSTDAVQIFGGYGLLEDYPVEMLMRDAKGFAIFTGTNQIQRAVIAREMLGRDMGRTSGTD